MPIQVLDLIAPAQAPRKNAAPLPGDGDAFGRLVGDAGADLAKSPQPASGSASADAATAGSVEQDKGASGEFASAAVDISLLLGVQPVPLALAPKPEADVDGAIAAPVPPVTLVGALSPAAVTSAGDELTEADGGAPGVDPVSGDADIVDDAPDPKVGAKVETAPAPSAQVLATPASAIAVAPPQPGAMLRELAALRRDGVLEVRGSVKAPEAAAPGDGKLAAPVTEKAGLTFAEMFAAASAHDASSDGLPADLAPGDPVLLPGAERAAGADHAARLQTGHTQASSHAAATNVPISALSTEIAARAAKGMTQFEIRLDPPELGKIDVSLKIDGEGQVISRLVVERAETLDLLKSDQRALERALEQAGLRAEQGALQFELRNGNGGTAGRDPQALPRLTTSEDGEMGEGNGPAIGQIHSAGRHGATGVDIRI